MADRNGKNWLFRIELGIQGFFASLITNLTKNSQIRNSESEMVEPKVVEQNPSAKFDMPI